MFYRQLGAHGPKVSALGYGCMVLSGMRGAISDADATSTLHRALDLGVTLLDTADCYGFDNHNEKLVGNAIKGRRDKLVISTKFGNVRGPNQERLGVCGKPAYVRRCCDASLSRLGVDTIDIYLLHRVDPETLIEESVGAMADLVKAGKVRYIGLCEASENTIRRAHKVHPLTVLQSEYSLWTRDIEAEILPTLRECGIGIMPFSPLGRGFLTGRVRSREDLTKKEKEEWPRFSEENLGKNITLLETIEPLAKSKGCTLAQLALAWLLAQGDDVVPIPSTRRISRLEENLGASNVSLSQEDLAKISNVFALGAASGTRYTEKRLKMTGI